MRDGGTERRCFDTGQNKYNVVIPVAQRTPTEIKQDPCLTLEFIPNLITKRNELGTSLGCQTSVCRRMRTKPPLL